MHTECPGLVSVAVLNTMISINLGGKDFTFQVTVAVEAGPSRNPEATRSAVYWLAPQGLLG